MSPPPTFPRSRALISSGPVGCRSIFRSFVRSVSCSLVSLRSEIRIDGVGHTTIGGTERSGAVRCGGQRTTNTLSKNSTIRTEIRDRRRRSSSVSWIRNYRTGTTRRLRREKRRRSQQSVFWSLLGTNKRTNKPDLEKQSEQTLENTRTSQNRPCLGSNRNVCIHDLTARDNFDEQGDGEKERFVVILSVFYINRDGASASVANNEIHESKARNVVFCR